MNFKKIFGLQSDASPASSEEYELNLNRVVRVKLTNVGYQRLADFANKWGFSRDRYTAIEFKEKADSEGYTAMQMWELIEKFGGGSSVSMTECLFVDIRIRTSDLKECNPQFEC